MLGQSFLVRIQPVQPTISQRAHHITIRIAPQCQMCLFIFLLAYHRPKNSIQYITFSTRVQNPICTKCSSTHMRSRRMDNLKLLPPLLVALSADKKKDINISVVNKPPIIAWFNEGVRARERRK